MTAAARLKLAAGFIVWCIAMGTLLYWLEL